MWNKVYKKYNINIDNKNENENENENENNIEINNYKDNNEDDSFYNN